jgi:hypothetical protein
MTPRQVFERLLAGFGSDDWSRRDFQVANIQVLRVRDGLILETRDYHNHAVLADVLT